MKSTNKKLITLDKFIDNALYNKNSGFYMNKNPIGKNGDFITSPNISILFSEMIAIWVISFWENSMVSKDMVPQSTVKINFEPSEINLLKPCILGP